MHWFLAMPHDVFQRAILGFEPEEIARLYVELDVTMSTLKEGIISIDDKGILRSINKKCL